MSEVGTFEGVAHTSRHLLDQWARMEFERNQARLLARNWERRYESCRRALTKAVIMAAVLGIATVALGVKAYGGVLPVPVERTAPAWRTAHRLSLVALAGSTAADAATSWRRHETNPLLAGSDGRFGWRGVAMKGASFAGMITLDRWMVRHPRFRVVVNFAAAGAFTAMAVRNARVR